MIEIEPGRKLPPRVQVILAQVAHEHGVLVSDILKRDQRAPMVAARREAIEQIRGVFGFSSVHIGRLLGLHHSTVLHHLPKRPSAPVDWSKPDESGVWAI